MLHKRRLNRKQIKFLIKFTLLLGVPNNRWDFWGKTKPNLEADDIYELLIRGSYTTEKEITDITFKYKADCIFMYGKTTEVWEAYRDWFDEMSHGCVLTRRVNGKHVKVWGFPTDIIQEIKTELRKQL